MGVAGFVRRSVDDTGSDLSLVSYLNQIGYITSSDSVLLGVIGAYVAINLSAPLFD